jgi:peptide/nickel transport system permease protein
MVKFPISKHRRAIWSRTIRGFWEDYKHNKIGLVGLGLLILYIIVAISAPWLTPYDPIRTKNLADATAMPEWVTIFPGLRKLPRTMEIQLSWQVKPGEELPDDMELVESGENIVVNYNGTTAQVANFTVVIFYPYSPPNTFKVRFSWGAENVHNAQYSIELFIMNPAGNEFLIWTSYSSPIAEFSSDNSTLFPVEFTPALGTLPAHIKENLLPEGEQKNIAREVIFVEPGEYKFRLQVRMRPASEQGTATILFKNSSFKVLGVVHGLLGTDHRGGDVFAQLVYGAQLSLAVGLSAAVLATSIGIIVGVITGYLGGFVDEITMRTVDILLCLPVLPLLLGLVVIFGTSIWYLVLLIAVFGWLGLSRIIRSAVLSIKEMPYIECARAAGASSLYIMRKHIIPNILPVALASLVLGVPAAILTEAGISFIGLGAPLTPTWGRMLNWAFQHGAFQKLAWWWILPPGLAITFITLAFVFIGHAVDEIVNPRLRRRR